jgi:hypothetical protein
MIRTTGEMALMRQQEILKEAQRRRWTHQVRSRSGDRGILRVLRLQRS